MRYDRELQLTCLLTQSTSIKGLLNRRPFFMRKIIGATMQTICPHCHSSRVTRNINADIPSSIIDQLCSSEALASVGVTICKYYKINPAIGVVAGNAIASAISLAKDKLQPPLLIVAAKPSFVCNTCFKAFSI